MDQTAIFMPMGALALITFSVLLLIPLQRFRAVARRQITAEDFRFGESVDVPGNVSIPNRNYMNLLELPSLFYVVCLMYYAAHKVDQTVVASAWGYVILRLAHSIIHLTYHNVVHRLTAFAASNVVLGVMWTLFFVSGFGHSV